MSGAPFVRVKKIGGGLRGAALARSLQLLPELRPSEHRVGGGNRDASDRRRRTGWPCI